MMKVRKDYSVRNHTCTHLSKNSSRIYEYESYGYRPSLIEGEPYISSVPLTPGLSNIEKPKADEQITNGLSNIKKESNGQRIIGLNDENIEINEGMIRFDIFYVRIPLKSNIADKDITITTQQTPKTDYHK